MALIASATGLTQAATTYWPRIVGLMMICALRRSLLPAIGSPLIVQHMASRRFWRWLAVRAHPSRVVAALSVVCHEDSTPWAYVLAKRPSSSCQRQDEHPTVKLRVPPPLPPHEGLQPFTWRQHFMSHGVLAAPVCNLSACACVMVGHTATDVSPVTLNCSPWVRRIPT